MIMNDAGYNFIFIQGNVSTVTSGRGDSNDGLDTNAHSTAVRYGYEIGYMLLNEYTNKGIATETVKQICTIAFKVLSLEQITANVFQPNIASMRVLLKNDFKYKGVIQNAVIKDGNVYDLLIYVLTVNSN